MKRRAFVQSTLAGLTSLAGASVAAGHMAAQGVQQRQVGFTVGAGKDRVNEPYALTIGHMECKVSGRDTAGAMAIFEALTHKEDRPVRHLHHEQDEWFFVVDGEYEMHIGDAVFTLGPGDSAFGPRKIPHVWGCTSEKPGRIIALLQPAGTIEEFFRELPKYIARKASLQELDELNRRHGMQTLGPRLPI